MGDKEPQVATPPSTASCAMEAQVPSTDLSGSDASSEPSSGPKEDDPVIAVTENGKQVSDDFKSGSSHTERRTNEMEKVRNESSPSSHTLEEEDSVVTVSAENSHNKLDASKQVSSHSDLNEDKIGNLADNPTPSVDSSPTTPSTSGQDSGVSLISPDDSSWETSVGSTNKRLEATGGADQSKGDTGIINAVCVQSVDSSIEKDLTSQMEASPVDTKCEADKTDNSSAVASGGAASDQVSVYYIKWVLFGTSNVPIITQNENGPCPLLAIMNVLLLKGKVTLAPMLEMVTSEQLMAYLADCIFENMPQNLSAITKANYEQNMQDAMGVMDKLQTGLDVNVKFTGVGDFEYTRELIIFDLLEISLYHGWLVDPQDPGAVKAINQCSYNQLVERIISLKQSDKESDVTSGLIAEQFLDRTASQLTYHGLCELSARVKDSELCVFFRNNHFNTLYKHKNELFLLVTDQGFLTENNVVWETLSNVDGDGHFVDASFRTYTKPLPPTHVIPDPMVPVGSPEQIDHDYQVALSLQEEDQPAPAASWPVDQNAAMLADHEFAIRLQEQENQRAVQEQQRQAVPSGQASGHVASGQGPSHPPQASSSQPDSQRRRAPDRPERKEKEGRDCSIL